LFRRQNLCSESLRYLEQGALKSCRYFYQSLSLPM
jgi:hypothetical protein